MLGLFFGYFAQQSLMSCYFKSNYDSKFPANKFIASSES